MAASGSRDESSRVMRVSRVPSANASTRPRPTTAACRKRTSARAYGSIEPLTSQSSTMRRGRDAGSRNARCDRLAAGAERRGAPCGAGRACPRWRRLRCWRRERRSAAGQPEVGHQPPGLGELGRRVRREVALAQHLGGAVAHRDRRACSVVVAGLGRVVVVARRRTRCVSSRATGGGAELEVVLVAPTTRGTRGRRCRRPRGAAPAWRDRPSTPRRGVRARRPRAPGRRRSCCRPARRGRRRAAAAANPTAIRSSSTACVGQALRSIAVLHELARGRARACAPGLRGTSGSCRG